jgi:DNA-binding NarL/FixJ family response regulator
MYPAFSPLEASHAGAVAGVTVVIADDHPAMLASIGEILARNGFDVVGQATDGQQALALIESTHPRVALVDVRMPRLSGIEVAVHAAEVAPETAIVFYTAFGDRALLSEALDAGVRGFVLKEAPLSGRLADRVPSLTQREREVLRLLADGHANEEIGKRLHISPETVRTHVRKAMAKLEADTRTQAVAIALRQSIIS